MQLEPSLFEQWLLFHSFSVQSLDLSPQLAISQHGVQCVPETSEQTGQVKDKYKCGRQTVCEGHVLKN